MSENDTESGGLQFGPFLAGSLAGMVGNLVGQPWDTVKVRMQSSGSRRGPLEQARRIVARDGVRALYRGTVPPLVSSAPVNAATFGGYESALKLLGVRKAEASPGQLYVAGCAGGAAMSFVLTPLDLVKCKLQASSPKEYRGPLDCARKVVRANGARGLYAGFSSTFLREAPSFGVYFSLYEGAFRLLNPNGESSTSLRGAAASCVAGGGAGACTWALVYPIDVVKTRIQTLPESAPPEDKSFLRAARNIYLQHGAQYFFRGLSVCVQRAFVVNFAIFPIYEVLSRKFN